MTKHKWVSVVASCDREKWLRGRVCPPAEILEEVIRELGLVITSRRLGRAHGRLDIKAGAIIINSLLPSLLDPRTDPRAVETWTLAHELGHYRLHRAQLQRGERNLDQERQAHAYAACFLLPRRELQDSLQFRDLVERRDAGTLTDDHRKELARQLAGRYRVTPSAVLVRFEELLPLQRNTHSGNLLSFPSRANLATELLAVQA